ncbi:MAG: protein kinase [Planctomycetes bacterium]|nr:protein kinase [Planctomycetota bacterium]
MPEPKPITKIEVTQASSIQPATASRAETLGVPPSDTPPLPERIGECVILGELGRGGMGVVYRAEDPHLKREIALKVMLPQFAANPDAKARFVREARAQAKVEHDHVAAIFQVAEHAGVPYLVMPLLKGMTLQAAIKANARPPLAEVIRIVREVAEGLAAAHEKGLVHRDIKPANVWLEGKKLRVKVLDFGLARVADAEATDATDGPLTAEGAIVGTPAYMSPEQARGDAVDSRTDLFSLGVMLYQMCAGELPFRGGSALAVLSALALHVPPPLITKNPAVPPALSNLVERLLSKTAEGRPPTAEAVAEALRAIELGLAGAVRVIPLGDVPPIVVADVNVGSDPFADLDVTEANSAPDGVPVDEAEPVSARVPMRTTKPRSGFPAWALVGMVLLAVAGVIGFVMSQMSKKPEEVAKEEPAPTPNPPVKPSKEAATGLLFAKGDQIEMPSLKLTGLDEYTIEAFINVKSIRTDAKVHFVGTQDLAHLHMDSRPGSWAWYTYHGQSVSPTPIVAGRVTHVAGVQRRTDRQLFVDGKLVATTASTPPPNRDYPPFRVFGDCEGSVREVRVSKVARYQKDFVPETRFKTDKDTLALYHLDEDTGSEAKDASGNNHTGKIRGGTWIKENGSDTADPERKAAKLFNPYANLALQVGTPPKWVPVDCGQALPTEPYVVVSIAMVQNVAAPPAGFTEKAVPALARLGSLNGFEAHADRFPLSNEQLTQLADSRVAQTLTKFVANFEPSPTTWQALKKFRLNELGIYGSRITDESVAELPQFAGITWLAINDLGKSEKLTAKGWGKLLNFTRIETLYLGSPHGINANVGKVIAEIPGLKNLVFTNCDLDDASMQELSKTPNLQELDLLQEVNFPSSGLKHISEMKSLRNLTIIQSKVRPDGLKFLTAMKRLRYLRLPQSSVTEEEVKMLSAALPQCRIEWDKGVLEPSDPHFREALRWINTGGMVHVKLADGKTVGVPNPTTPELPDEPFTITGVSHGAIVADEHVKGFEAIPTITSVDFVSSRLTVEGMRAFRSSSKTLTNLKLIGNSLPITNGMLEVMGEFSNLNKLNLWNPAPTLTEWNHLNKLKELQRLRLTDPGLSDEALKQITTLPKLVELDLGGTPISDASIGALSGMKQLTALSIKGTRITEAGFKKLKDALPHCKIEWEEPTRAIMEHLLRRGNAFVLVLQNGSFHHVSKPEGLPVGPFSIDLLHLTAVATDADMLWVESLPPIGKVQLSAGHKITPAGFQSLLKHKDTITTFLFQVPMNEEEAKIIGQLTSLETLHIDGTRLSESQAKLIAGLPRLKSLELPNCDLTDKGFTELARLTMLDRLHLTVPSVTDASVEHLAAMKLLRVLDIRGTRITEAGFNKLKAALPDCEILWEEANRHFAKWALTRGEVEVMLTLPDGKEITPKKVEELPAGAFTVTSVNTTGGYNPIFSDQDFRRLQLLGNLKQLHLGSPLNVTVEEFRGVLAHKDTLTRLNLSTGRVLFTDEGIKVIGQLSKLKFLGVGDPNFSSEGLAPLAGHEQLEQLRFYDYATVTDTGLKHLSTIKNLYMLVIPYSRISDAGLEHVPQMKSLLHLDISHSAVTDAGMKHLAEIKTRFYLSLSNTIVSDASIEQFASMKLLATLTVRNTRITEAGVKKFKAWLPNCPIDWSPAARGLRFDNSSRVNFDNFKLDLTQPLTFEGYITVDPEQPANSHPDQTCIYFDTRLHVGWSRGKWHARIWSKDSVSQDGPVSKRTHVAGIFENNTVRLYVDGKLIGSKSITTDKGYLKQQSDFHLGYFFPSVLEEVRVSNVARYDKDFTPAARFATDKNTLALYHLDEGTPDVVTDSSGNGRHGKITGAAWAYPNEPKKP